MSKNSDAAKKRTFDLDCLGLGIMPLDLLFEVEAHPSCGSKIDALSLTMQGGGPVPNVLVGLARLGFRTALITAVADDPIGRQGLSEMTDEGVDVSHVVVKGGVSDTAAGLIVKGSGERTLVLNRILHVLPRDIDTSTLPRPRLVHLDGRDVKACMKLARWGRKAGATVCFDIGSMRNDVSPVFPLVDHLVVADAFALPFTGTRKAESAVKKLAEYGPKVVVVTEGVRGSVGLEEGVMVRRPAIKVPVADTTGAGDAFHTGYMYGLLEGCDLATRMDYGAATAAMKCTKMGARTGLPGKARLRAFMKRKLTYYA